jgi:ribosomal protein S18 acetylase RimI-like enzyme
MTLTIREAETKDVPSIASIHVRAWQDAYRGQLDDAYLDGLDVEERIPQTRSMLQDSPPEFRTWVAQDGPEVVGFAVTGPSQDADAEKKTGELYAIYLEPDRVGTGVGRTLLEHAVADLAERGFTEATLWILGSNARSRRFYEAAGWAPDGTTASEHVDVEMRSTVRYRVKL